MRNISFKNILFPSLYANFAAVSKFIQAKGYLQYLLSAKSRHGVHSPFVYSLLDEVIYSKNTYPEFTAIENLRAELLKDSRTITITDLGAGSTVNTNKTRRISDIAKNSAKAPKLAQLIFRLTKKLQPKNILELGTSLGISTAYLSKACPASTVYTIEGCPETAKVAQGNFEKLGLDNVHLSVGNFDEQLPTLLKKVEQLDLVFVDGNHRKEPTLDYFKQCLEKAHENTVFIFDDIHWSQGMEEAWGIIKKHESVTITLDLFFIGIVFLRKEQVKENFVIRF